MNIDTFASIANKTIVLAQDIHKDVVRQGMGLYDLYQQVKNDPACSHFFRDPKDNPYTFFRYLNEVQFLKISVKKITNSRSIEENAFPVVSRYCETYRKSILAKFFQLEEWFEEEQPPVTFLTLTSRYITDREQFFENLFYMREMFFNKFSKLKKNYVWIVEPHMARGLNNGYPHIHGIIFDDVSDHDQEKLKKWWEKKGMGDYDHGIVFEKSEKIRNIKNYIMKDMAKSWIRTEGRFSEGFKWDKDVFLFNFIMWKHTYRYWGASKELSNVMKRDIPFCLSGGSFSVDLLDSGDEPHKIFNRDVEEAISISNEKNWEKVRSFSGGL